jgi:heme/copper-type cytochrome/quinol oxidase subunit 2
MAASGGGMPRFENVKVAGLATTASVAAAADKALPNNVARAESKSNLLLIVVLLIIVVALGVLGWLVYMKFGG